MRWGLVGAVVVLVGCGEPPPEVGQVSFRYRFFEGTDPLLNCTNGSAGATIATVRLLLGDDGNGDGQLGDDEFRAIGEATCNQSDANGDGILQAIEFGSFTAEVVVGDYTFIAVEIIDDSGNLLSWLAFDQVLVATRNSFAQTVSVTADNLSTIAIEDPDSEAAELRVLF
jgi:hypothetical protein